MTSDTALQIEIDGPLVVLRLNRPAARNALNADLLEQFAQAVEQLERREDVVAGLICGAGASFCAGADLFELARMAPGEARGLEQLASNTFERLARLPIVWVAALHGHAVGGGLLISLYADVRLAAAGTQLGFPAASQAWLPPWGLSRLAGWVGAARAESLLLSAGLFDAHEAARWGLVDRIVAPAELDGVARETAARLARSRRAVVAEVRHFFASLRATDHAHWDRVAAAGFERSFATREAREAIRRFVAPGSESTSDTGGRAQANRPGEATRSAGSGSEETI